MPEDSYTGNRKLSCDVVSIGGGGSGLAAAVSAAEKGVKVIALEKRKVTGGNTSMAGGMFAAESHVQKQRMVDARRDELFKIAMDYAHWRINPRIIRAFIDKSGDTISWLEEKGVKFASLPAMYPNQRIRTMHIPRGGGAELTKVLTEKCKAMGIKVLCSSPAKIILLDKRGKISGVIAEVEGKEVTIKAKTVVIASGGYGGNKEFLKRYYPSYHKDLYTIGMPHTGDGLTMAMKIGAATEGLGILQLAGPGFHGSSVVRSLAQEPNTLWVNKYGKRYSDESIGFDISLRGNVVDMQPDKVSYTLFDETIKNFIAEKGMAQFTHGFGMPQPGTKVEGLNDSIQSEIKKGKVKSARTLAEIAVWMGAEPSVLKATVEEYNKACDQGHDSFCVKDPQYLMALRQPPYYAIKCQSCFTDTMGGIKVNEKMEVISELDRPIPGLYAAGVCVGGWESETYCYILSGSTVGFALNSGRIAGENAAEYALRGP